MLSRWKDRVEDLKDFAAGSLDFARDDGSF
jgi:hypothetical protein